MLAAPLPCMHCLQSRPQGGDCIDFQCYVSARMLSVEGSSASDYWNMTSPNLITADRHRLGVHEWRVSGGHPAEGATFLEPFRTTASYISSACHVACSLSCIRHCSLLPGVRRLCKWCLRTCICAGEHNPRGCSVSHHSTGAPRPVVPAPLQAHSKRFSHSLHHGL